VDVNIVVDGGIGFGDPVHMGRTIRMIEDAGAAAIEIEDQVAPKRVHHHKGVEHLVSTEMMRWRIEAAVEARRDRDFVLIVRCNAISHEGMEGALERAAAYAEAGADLLMLMHRNQAEFEAVSAGTTLPLAAMTIGPGRTREAMLAAGYALEVDPMSATALGFRALQAGYEGIRDRTGFGMSREEVMAVIHDVGETIGIEALYAVEERTTEKP